jgi:methanogenic corrinoid protein MtbC1
VTLDDRPSLDTAALIADLKTACLAYDDDTAHQVMHRAASMFTPHQIFRRIVLPVVTDVGRAWAAGLVNVAQEHFTSMLTRRFALRLLDLSTISASSPPIVCACAPDELHELGLLAVAVEARFRGFPVVYLGQATPVDAALAAIERLESRVAVVAVTLAQHLEPYIAVRDRVAEFTTRTGATVVWGGPGAASADLRGLPGSVASTIDDAVAAIVAAMGWAA